jgi:hypothetical protein
MNVLAWLCALISVPLTFAVDTARAVGGANALGFGLGVWLAGLLLVLARAQRF